LPLEADGAALTLSGSCRSNAATLVIAMFLALATIGCDDVPCSGEEQFIVNEGGTCAAMPQQFTLSRTGCDVSLSNPSGDTGLPAQGAMGPHPGPLRQGGFLLFDDKPTFRLCRAVRVDYRLELSCVDSNDAPVCQAELTEPAF
jgi:hypothetical protein